MRHLQLQNGAVGTGGTAKRNGRKKKGRSGRNSKGTEDSEEEEDSEEDSEEEEEEEALLDLTEYDRNGLRSVPSHKRGSRGDEVRRATSTSKDGRYARNQSPG